MKRSIKRREKRDKSSVTSPSVLLQSYAIILKKIISVRRVNKYRFIIVEIKYQVNKKKSKKENKIGDYMFRLFGNKGLE